MGDPCIYLEWLLIKTFMIYVLHFLSYGFGYDRKWKLRLWSNTAVYIIKHSFVMECDTIQNLFIIIINLLLQTMNRLLILFLSLVCVTKFGSSRMENCYQCTGFGGSCDVVDPPGGTQENWTPVLCTTSKYTANVYRELRGVCRFSLLWRKLCI